MKIKPQYSDKRSEKMVKCKICGSEADKGGIIMTIAEDYADFLNKNYIKRTDLTKEGYLNFSELPDCNDYVEVNEKKLMATLENIGTINKETHQLEFDLFELDMLKKAIQEASLLEYKGE